MDERPSDKRRPKVPNLGISGGHDGESTKIRLSPDASFRVMRRDRPFLVVIGGGSVGEMFALRQPEVLIGRARDATVRLDDDGVSRRHARLVCIGSEVHIEDLGSANGTFVNGDRVASRPLADGDKITLGSITILKFTYSDDLDETFQRRMFDASLRDGLTKAYNKNYMLERVDKELAYARRHGAPLSVIMLDIDHFKKINDTFGHPAGDAVLIQLTNVALDMLRKEDIFARYGGEEFAVICRGVAVKDAGRLAERLREAIAVMRIVHEGRELAVTGSFGVAGFPELNAESPAQLISAADAALYEAKRGGRNRVVARACEAGREKPPTSPSSPSGSRS
ncbi:MAG: GGDEF domain-containing protein [Polyangiaceae bacterium]|jgi:diguanylate cyclase (GGDEF)-like protein